MELKPVLTKELFQSGGELAPEDATQRGDRKKNRLEEAIPLEPWGARPPAGTT